MSFVFSGIWCLVALSACLLTMKYFIPFYLKQQKHIEASDGAKPSDDDVVDLLNNKTVIIIAVSLISLYAALSGYFAFIHVESEDSNMIINLVRMSLGVVVLCAVSITDLKLQVIPNLFVFVLLVGRLLIVIAEFILYGLDAWTSPVGDLIFALVVGLLLFIAAKLTKGGLGAGDIKLFTALTFMCGLQSVFFTLLFSLLASALFSIVLLILKKKKLRDCFPMAPFILFGFGLTIILSIA